ncbi:hypothetical protein CGRA01v4_13005 [Colletotrichum graminicola]|uniref:Uncharacterized protein n=1 Tax=Colletotrichum graminicola (strain M1.001 / M2 / FGSC 10212) TaxID=645133 RepID=E3QLV7_COLGM|nr:uncharacterized protein GLRG_06989 [Colletotrichum graminicola M1.001]EFQ31845.1 hypothetical protein GLRG_06989 [Colletotrichum graminicola M1.001]WDK21715.1 hypothetical protein CGRA01v4_13005 [Colletotrichum graminicola]
MFNGTKGCSSIEYTGSLVTVCSTDSYQSICVDDNNGNVKCNMTLGSAFSIDGDFSHFFLPYGSIAWISNVIGCYIWFCIMSGNAPINPTRKIKHKTLVCLGGFAYAIILVVVAAIKVPKMKDRNLKLIVIGHVVATVIIQGAILHMMKSNYMDVKENTKNNNEDQPVKEKLNATVSTDAMDSVPSRPSTESTRSNTSMSTAVSISEKPGFLERFTSKIPGVQTAEEVPVTETTGTETPKKEETVGEGLASMMLGLAFLSPGHLMMLCGAMHLAKCIFVNRENNDTRQQRETRDSLILFGIIYGLVLVINIACILNYFPQAAAKSQNEESVDNEENEKRRAAEAKKLRETVLFAVGVLAGLVTDWCRYFVLAAAAKDTHGLMHLGDVSNLSLITLILSKLFVLAC